jgi:hypothetical protein
LASLKVLIPQRVWIDVVVFGRGREKWEWIKRETEET